MARTIEGDLTAPGMKTALVVSRFNSFITERLLEGALDALVRHGATSHDQVVVRVPGAWEIPLVVKRLADSGQYDAVIAIGAGLVQWALGCLVVYLGLFGIGGLVLGRPLQGAVAIVVAALLTWYLVTATRPAADRGETSVV